MSNKKSWLTMLFVLVFVFCFSFGAFAATGDITSPAGQANQYVVSADIANGTISTDDLYIGTVADYLGSAANGSTTVFENGEAIHPDDIIIINNKVGIVLSVGTRNPWGYPSGSVLDAGRVNGAVDGTTLEGNVTFGRDTVWSVEFLMNGWDSWSPNNCGTVSFELAYYNFDTQAESTTGAQAGYLPAVKVSRVYEEVGDLTFDVVTYYSIGEDNEYAYIFDTVQSNNAIESSSLSNRFSVTNKGDDGGAMASLTLLTGINSYGKSAVNTFATTLILPGSNTGYVSGSSIGDHPWSKTGGSVGYKELRANYKYAANEYRVYDEYLFIDDQADTSAVVDFLIDYDDSTLMNVNGTVYAADEQTPVPYPVIIAMQGSTVYGWFIGNADGTYSINLPEGEYNLYVEANGFAKGQQTTVNTEAANNVSLYAGDALVEVTFNIEDTEGNPLWARVDIDGLYPTVRFTGNAVFYAEDEDNKGTVVAMVPPGEFTAEVFGEGYYFYSDPVTNTYDTTVATSYDVEINLEYSAPEGWVSTDPHHHANKNDAFAMPEDVVKSCLAAGLDVIFTTDHDFTTNNYETYTYAEAYDVLGYLPSEEISASWAHFNVIPQTSASYEYFLDKDQENNTMDQFADFKDFVQQTHDAGATITANHPYYSYGLFYTNENSTVPGGYDNSFDTIELNACCDDVENIATINKATELWSAYLSGDTVSDEAVTKAHYLLAGSDTHDVLYPGIENTKGSSSMYHSGKGRTFAYIGDTTDLSVEEAGLATGQAIANGNSYASFGPILTPEEDVMFGEEYVVTKADDWTFETSIEVESLNGVEAILLLSNDGDGSYDYNGYYIENVLDVAYYNGENSLTYTISEIPDSVESWYSIMVIDSSDAQMFAISNPYWVTGENPYTDITSHWGTKYILPMTFNGILNGYSDRTFRPDAIVTRAEFSKMIAESFCLMETDEVTTLPFTDVSADAWYFDYIQALYDTGIVFGVSEDEFRPNDPIKRQDISTIMYRMLMKWSSVEDKNFEWADFEAAFTDANKVSEYAKEACMFMFYTEVMQGRGNSIFAPQDYTTRAEGATVLYRFMYGFWK